MRTRPLLVLVPAALAALAVAVIGTAPDPRPLLADRPRAAIEVRDRYGGRLRLIPDAEGIRARPVDLDTASPHLVDAVLAAEDRRFFAHPGIDPLAALRAAWTNLVEGRVVSGGSTLTMQLARLLDPRPRGAAAKARQVLLAIRLEMALDKRAILREVLERAPMGHRIVGYAAASEIYLGKPLAQLSPAEAATLAAIPRSPGSVTPWRNGAALRERRAGILDRMHRLGRLERGAWEAARREPIVLAEEPYRARAPDFVARVVDEAGALPVGATGVETPLDPELQERVETIVRQRLEDLAADGITAIAVAVLDARRNEWIAIEGSGSSRGAPWGSYDGTRIPRQPGSALKPFTYAAAFDRNLTPATVLADLPRSFPGEGGAWTPRNYDDRFHGPLRAREALACSINVAAATVLETIGPGTLLETLRRAGISTLGRPPEFYGLGLTLGAGEVRLDELTLAYAALLRGGAWRPATSWRRVVDARGRTLVLPRRGEERRVVSRESAAQVVDVLADPEARARSFGAASVLRLPFPAMVKTGTSEGFRDNWCVGGTREVVVGVWCGNFSREAMGNVSGVAGSGTVWREVMLAWEDLRRRRRPDDEPRLPEAPRGMERRRVCALSGLAPHEACPRTVAEIFRPGTAPRRRCSWHLREAEGVPRIAWPPEYRVWARAEGLVDGVAGDGALQPAAAIAVSHPGDGEAYLISPDVPRRYQTIELRCAVRGRPREVVWLVDGRSIGRAPDPYAVSWPLEPGEHRIEAVTDTRRSRPVFVTVY